MVLKNSNASSQNFQILNILAIAAAKLSRDSMQVGRFVESVNFVSNSGPHRSLQDVQSMYVPVCPSLKWLKHTL